MERWSGQLSSAIEALDGMLAPDAIADTYYALHRQDRSAWSLEVDVRTWCEKF